MPEGITRIQTSHLRVIIPCFPSKSIRVKIKEKEMMESQLLQPPWALYNHPSSSFDHTGLYSFAMDIPMDDPCDFSSSFASEESSGISFDSYFAAMTASPDSLVEFPSFSDEKQVMETIAHIMQGCGGPTQEQDCRWMEESDRDGNISSQLTCESEAWTPNPVEQSKPSTSSSTSTAANVFPSKYTLTLPGGSMETDNQACLNHLLRAYGEAVENGHQELAEVIVRRINEKIDPLGEPLERVAFNLFQSNESQGNYIRQQSSKNLEAAFEACYRWYPYGRFAHFTANSAILQAMPSNVDTVHVVDFDMGEGIQWPPLIETISRKGKTALRFTSIKSKEDPQWNFEDTEWRLCDHARSLGLNLRVEEMELEALVTEIKRTKKRGGAREWLAFNLMVALPHMGRQPDRSHVTEFLRVAKDLLAHSAGNSGIIIFGDGEAEDYSATCPEYASFFNSRFKHYQALFESMECDFPVYLPEARIAMESLFASPYVSSHSWYQQWKGTKEGGQAVHGLEEGWRMSRESLIEAKQIVNQQDSLYKVLVQGKENEMVLEWKGIPLVRVSCWT